MKSKSMTYKDIFKELFDNERIEYLPMVVEKIISYPSAIATFLSYKDKPKMSQFPGAEYLRTVPDSQNRLVKVWRIEFEGRKFYVLTHKERGTSYETKIPADQSQCVRFFKFLESKGF